MAPSFVVQSTINLAPLEPPIVITDVCSTVAPARSTMLHELQHAIQEKEGFGVGGNTDTMDRMIGKVKDRAFLIKERDSKSLSS